jgi:hypothetical protein
MFKNIPAESAEAPLTPWNTVALLELAETVLVPNCSPAIVRVKLDDVVPTDATSATSPLTLPFPEFVGEADKASGVRLKVGVMVKPSNGGEVQQSEKSAELETCILSSNAMLLPVTVIGEDKLTVGP